MSNFHLGFFPVFTTVWQH